MIISILDQLKFPLRFSQTQVSSNQTVKCFRANNDDDTKKKEQGTWQWRLQYKEFAIWSIITSATNLTR